MKRSEQENAANGQKEKIQNSAKMNFKRQP